ncbi:MAG: hypothetical protein KDC44_15005 [Phaeodactylibacter sp.]|nr:hypothetical protein [Phaeodactylibacter sp.]
MSEMKKLTYIVCLMLVPFLTTAQSGLSVGGFLGASNYQGDLAEFGIVLRETQPAFGGYLKYNFLPFVGARINMVKGKLSGNDANNPSLFERKFSFEADLFEAAFLIELSLFNKGNRHKFGGMRKLFSPYIYGGFGFTIADAVVDYSQSDDIFIKEPFPEEGDKADFVTIPMGVGVRFQGFERLRLALEFGFRPAFSDYLDGISLNGRADRNDWYVLGGLTISYKFVDPQYCGGF